MGNALEGIEPLNIFDYFKLISRRGFQFKAARMLTAALKAANKNKIPVLKLGLLSVSADNQEQDRCI
jgi:hypothetical protein